MLFFCFHSHTFVVYLQTTKVHSNQRFQGTHSTLSTPEIPPVKSPHAFGFPIVNTPLPMPSEFHNSEPPSPLEILKAVRGKGVDIFWNPPFHLACNMLYKRELH